MWGSGYKVLKFMVFHTCQYLSHVLRFQGGIVRWRKFRVLVRGRGGGGGGAAASIGCSRNGIMTAMPVY